MSARVPAAILFTCVVLTPAAFAGPVGSTITHINAANAGDPSNNVTDAAMSGAMRGAIAGGIAGGIVGFFGLVKKFGSKSREEPTNQGREGRPYF
jgi:Na+/glutamate symporter